MIYLSRSFLDVIPIFTKPDIYSFVKRYTIPYSFSFFTATSSINYVSPKATKCFFFYRDKSHYENVPTGWVKVKGDEIFQLLSGRDLPSSECNSIRKGIPYLIGASNIKNDGTISFVRWTEHPEVVAIKDDVLISCKGTIGEIIINKFGDIHIARQFMALRSAIIVPDYLNILMQANATHFKASAKGVIPGISREDVLNLETLVPPIDEQKRIAIKVNIFKSVLDTIEAGANDIERHINNIKINILNLAISGKLVPQDPSDEPAIELLRRINPDFKPCDNSHYPYELPNGWTLSTFGTLNEHKTKSVNPSSLPETQFELYSVPIYDYGYPETLLGKEIGSTKQSVEKGDVLLCKINPHINRVWVVEHYENDLQCIASSEWIIFSSKALLPAFAEIMFSSSYFRELLMSNVSGVGGSLMRARKSAVNGFCVPIPPIKEQERILRSYSVLIERINSLKEAI